MRKVFLFLPIISLMLCGCQSYFVSNIAELHYCFFTAENELCLVNAWSGRREEPYEMDGTPKRLVDFTLICFTPKLGEFSSCSIDVNGRNYVLSLKKSPFDSTLACDLGFLVKDTDSLVIYVLNQGENLSLPLKCNSTNYGVNYESAFRIGSKCASSFLKETEQYEVYLKIITNKEQIQFWYFRVLSATDDFTCVIDVNTGEVLISK